MGFPAEEARQDLYSNIAASCELALRMQKDLPSSGSRQLMELKASYLDEMICLLPVEILSDEVRAKRKEVVDDLKNYW